MFSEKRLITMSLCAGTKLVLVWTNLQAVVRSILLGQRNFKLTKVLINNIPIESLIDTGAN